MTPASHATREKVRRAVATVPEYGFGLLPPRRSRNLLRYRKELRFTTTPR